MHDAIGSPQARKQAAAGLGNSLKHVIPSDGLGSNACVDNMKQCSAVVACGGTLQCSRNAAACMCFLEKEQAGKRASTHRTCDVYLACGRVAPVQR